MLATFDGPVRAVRCGLAVAEHRCSQRACHVSVGLHTAEVARRGADVSGDGVAVDAGGGGSRRHAARSG